MPTSFGPRLAAGSCPIPELLDPTGAILTRASRGKPQVSARLRFAATACQGQLLMSWRKC